MSLPPLVIGKRRGDQVRGLLRTGALSLGVLLLTLVLSYTAFRRWTLITPPVDHGPALPNKVTVELLENGVPRMTLDRCWLERRQGLLHLHLAGDPRTVGNAHGLLLGRLVAAADRTMVRAMDQELPGIWKPRLSANALRWHNRNLPDQIPPRSLVELAAFGRHMVDAPDLPEHPFHRLVYYHALFDLTRDLDRSPLLGSHAFAVWGNQTVTGHILVGRTLEVPGGALFDREKVLQVNVPEVKDRIPFASLSWPGMLGVYTGVNANRLFVAINSARTDDGGGSGLPAVFLARELLERASTLNEAIALLKKWPVMSPVAMLLADGKRGSAAVVEKSPVRMAVRRSAEGYIATTNHFQHAKFKSDASNDWIKRYTTSDARARRLEQLLDRFGGRIDVLTAAMVMRNRTGVDDEPLGLGNRNALDSLSATHGVVLDLSEMKMWVSGGPHLAGAFKPVDVGALLGRPVSSARAPQPIPADPLYGSSGWRIYTLALEQVEHARWLRKRGYLGRALDYASRAVALNPDLPTAQKLTGDIFFALGRPDEAAPFYRAFLKLHPPFLKDLQQVKQRLAQ